MIYSRYEPDTGLYQYFADDRRVGMGDDLPVPQLETINGIGASSTAAGRPMPSGARRIGRGSLPRGMMTTMDRQGLSGTSGELQPSQQWALVAIAAAVGFVLGRMFKR